MIRKGPHPGEAEGGGGSRATGAHSEESLATDPRVYAARVELVYELTPRSLLASLSVSILCAAFFAPGNPPLAAPAWWLALTAVTAVRYYGSRL